MFPVRWINQIVRRSTSPRSKYNPFRFRPKVEILEERTNPSNVVANTFTDFAQNTPAIVRGLDGDAVIVWQSSTQDGSGLGIFGRVFDAGGNPVGSEFRVNTTTANAQSHPSVGMDGMGGFIVVWESIDNTGGIDIVAQRFDSTGSKLGGEFLVNETLTGDQTDAAIAVDLDGDFVVTWTSQDANGLGVYARKFNLGSESEETEPSDSGEFLVNTTTQGTQASADVAIDSGGNFVVTWANFNPGLTSFDIMARRFDADGAPLGGEFRVNTFQNEAQINPTVASDLDGNFLIVWQSLFQDGSDFGIYAQRYNANGTTLGGEFRVNDTTTGGQITPDVALSPSGDFVVVWDSVGQDGSADGIYAKTYSSTGVVITAEFILNEVTAGAQMRPGVSLDAGGNYTVVWDSPGVDSSAQGVVFDNRVLRPNLAPVAAPIPPVQVTEDSVDLSVVDLTGFFQDDFTPRQFLRFSVIGASNPLLFTGVSADNGQLLLDYASDATGTSTVTIRVTDLSGAFTDVTILVNVTPVNDAPTGLSLDSNTVNENSPAGTVVGVFTTVDPDSPETFTYTLVGGIGSENNADFQIVGDQLRVLSVPNFESGPTSRNIRVRATDSTGMSVEFTFVVDVLDASEAPTAVVLSGMSVLENSRAGTSVGTFSSVDEDSGDTATFELFEDGTPNDNALFQIVNGNELVTAATFDRELSPTRTILVRVTDGTGLSVVRAITINVTDVNEGPTDFGTNSIRPLFENAGPNFAFLQLFATDPEGGPVTFSLDGGVLENDLFTIVGDQLLARNSFDFEAQSIYSVQVRVTDAQGNAEIFGIQLVVTDVNEPPINLTLNNVSVPENQRFFPVGTLSADDPDLGDSVTFTLEPGEGSSDNFRFFIDGNTLFTSEELDFESLDTLSIRVRATDNHGLFVDRVFTFTVFDNNDRPTFTAGPSLVVSPGSSRTFENWATDISAGSPAEAGQSVTFVISSVSNPEFFSVQPTISPDGTLNFRVHDFGPSTGLLTAEVFYALRDDGGTADGGRDTSFLSSFIVTIDPTQIVPREIATPLPSDGDSQRNLAVAHDALGNYIVVWDENNGGLVPARAAEGPPPNGGDRLDIVAQLFDAAGNARGNAFLVNLETTGDQFAPSVAMDANGNFVITWAEQFYAYYPGEGSNPGFYVERSRVVAQRFDGLGNRLGGELTLVQDDEIGRFVDPDVASDADGDFLVSWTNRLTTFIPGPSNGGSFVTVNEIHASRFDRSGSAIFEDVIVSGASDSARNSAVAMDADGDAVIVWEADGDQEDIFAQRLDSSGNFIDGIFRVNEVSAGRQFTPDVGMDANGNFVVAWDDFTGTDPIVARRFDAQGNPLSGDFLVAIGSGNVGDPSVSVRSDGTFAIAWTDEDGGLARSAAVDFRVYRPDGQPLGTVVRASGNNSSNDRTAAIILSDVRDEIVVAYAGEVSGGEGETQALQSRFVFSAAPSGVVLSPDAVSENAASWTLVGTLFGQDPDAGETFTYSATIPQGTPFFLGGPNNDQIFLNGSLDFETRNFYVIPVTVTDSTGLSSTFDVVIYVLDGNDPPIEIFFTDAESGSSFVDVAIVASNGSNVGYLSTYDPNFDFPFTYELIDNAGGRFDLVGDTVILRDASLLSLGQSYTIRVRSTDAGGLSIMRDFTIGVIADDDTQGPTINIFGSSFTETDAGNQFFGWDISDPSGLSFVSVTVFQGENVVFTSAAASGTFDFNGLGLGDFSIAITATDNDQDTPEDTASSSNAQSVRVIDDDNAPPETTTGGSVEVENDGQTQFFTWNVNDFSGGAAFAQVRVFQNGNLIFEDLMAPAEGNFNFDQFGLGTFEIFVTGFDTDNDRPGDALSSTSSRSVTVVDDDTRGPDVNVSGSQGVELDSQQQQFVWSVNDFNGAFTTQVRVFKDGALIYENLLAPAEGSFNFDPFGPGVFEIVVTGIDDDNDFPGDANATTRSLSVTVLDDDPDPPVIDITGSSGVEADGVTQQFVWNVTDSGGGTPTFAAFNPGVLTTEVRVFQDGVMIFEDLMAPTSGSFNFDSFGPGTFEIFVTANDGDSDFPGDDLTSSASRSVVVGDDDIAPPAIDLSGSGANVGTGTPVGDFIETEAENQSFSWSVSDISSGVSSTVVVVRKDGQVIFSSDSVSGTFDFNAFGVGDYLITVTATDGDNDSAGDSSSSTRSRRVTVIDDGPEVILGGSEGVQSDGETQEFTWDVSSLSSAGSFAMVQFLQDGQVIGTSTELSGTFNFDAQGLGTFTMLVLGGVAGEGEEGSVIDARSVFVFDDVPTTPVVTVTGSSGREEEDSTSQRFAWTTSDASLGAALSVIVTVMRNGVPFFTSNEANGELFFNNRGEGMFTISVRVSNSDNDFVGDEGIAIATRSVEVFDVDGDVGPLPPLPPPPPDPEPPIPDPPAPPTPPTPPTPPPAVAPRVLVTIQPTLLGFNPSIPSDSGEVMGSADAASSFVGEDQILANTVVELRELGNVAILLSDLDLPSTPPGQSGVAPPLSEQIATLTADPDELKAPEARPIALPSVAVSSVLDGDDSVRLIEQLDRMSQPIQAKSLAPKPIDRGPTQPPAVEFLPDEETQTEKGSEASPDKSNGDAMNIDGPVGETSLVPSPGEEPRASGALGWVVAGALVVPGVVSGWRRWVRRRFGIG